MNSSHTIVIVVAGPLAGLAQAQLFSENFDSLELRPFESPSEGGGDGTDWTDALPAGWMRDNGATPAGGPVEFFGFNVLDKNSWIATAGNQSRDSFTRASGNVLVADPDEYDDAGNIDPDLFNVLVQTGVIDLRRAGGGAVELSFDSSFRPYDGMTGLVDVSFDGGSTFENLLTLTGANSGGDSSLSRADERISFDLSTRSGDDLVVRFGMTNAGNDWWWAIDNVVVTPTPAAAVLFGLAGLRLGGRRR